MCANNLYKGKYFSILGDSISTLEGYNPPDYAVFYDWINKCRADVLAPCDTWWGQVIDALGGELLVNNAFSGSQVCNHPSCEIPSYGCSDARTGGLGTKERDPDVIMILVGLNDWGRGMRLTPSDGREGEFVFSVAYGIMLEKIRRNYPDAEIWCLTLPWSCWTANPDFAPPSVRLGQHIREYCDTIRACGERAGCRVIEIYHPDQPYDTIDGYHPNADGMRTLSAAVLKGLERTDPVCL